MFSQRNILATQRERKKNDGLVWPETPTHKHRRAKTQLAEVRDNALQCGKAHHLSSVISRKIKQHRRLRKNLVDTEEPVDTCFIMSSCNNPLL